MSTLKTTVIQNPSSGTANITLGTSGQVTFGGAVTGSGMDLINTTTFSAVSSVSVNNCFTSTYQNYEIILNVTASAAVGMLSRFRVGGTDNSSGTYFDAVFKANNNNTAGMWSYNSNATANTLFTIDPTYGSTLAKLTIGSPQESAKTMGTILGSGGQSGVAAVSVNSGGLLFNATTQFDGITFYVGSGNITGSVRVYGLKNA